MTNKRKALKNLLTQTKSDEIAILCNVVLELMDEIEKRETTATQIITSDPVLKQYVKRR